MSTETVEHMSDLIRRNMRAERALSVALARIERWREDVTRQNLPPADEIRSAIIDIRNTLQEIQS